MVLGEIAAIVLAGLVGLSLGALGSGGSIITTPLLVYVAHVPPANAIGMSLVIVGATSFVGVLLHRRLGNVAVKPMLLFALTGTVGSFLGSNGTHLLSRKALMLLFSGIMLFVGRTVWRGAGRNVRKAQYCGVYQCLLAGFFVGLLTGFLGVGGGFLIVPALILFAGLETRIAAGTSLGVITCNCVTGLLGQLRFVRINWLLLSGFLAFALVGMLAGAKLSGHVSESRLRRVLAITIVVLAVAVGFQNLVS
jgi:uncharacterized membrane protein YfcA